MTRYEGAGGYLDDILAKLDPDEQDELLAKLEQAAERERRRQASTEPAKVNDRGYVELPDGSLEVDLAHLAEADDEKDRARLTAETPEGTIDFGYRPRSWQRIVHRFMADPNIRGAVIVAARQHGKGELTYLLLVLAALHRHGDYLYVAPTRVTAKAVAWDRIKAFARKIPGVQVKEGDLVVRIPATDRPGEFSTISLIGANDQDTGASSARGRTITGFVLDEAGQCSMDFVTDVLMPTQTAIDNPWAVFIGTVRGQADALAAMFQMACREPNWVAIRVPMDRAGVFNAKRQAEIEATFRNPSGFRREYLCDFGVGTEDQVVRTEKAIEAQRRDVPERMRQEYRKMYSTIAGLDVGIQDRDRSVLAIRNGPALLHYEVITNPSAQELALRVFHACRKWQVHGLFVDRGHAGKAICDLLRQYGLTPIEIDFGGRAPDEEAQKIYANMRSFMAFEVADWIERDDTSIPDDQELLEELTVMRFKYQQNTNKLILESKDDIRDRIGRSPDIADAVMLTFAGRVPNPNLVSLDRLPARGGIPAFERGPDGSRYYSHNNSADAIRRRQRHAERMGFDPSARDFDDHHRWLDGEDNEPRYHGDVPAHDIQWR